MIRYLSCIAAVAAFIWIADARAEDPSTQPATSTTLPVLEESTKALIRDLSSDEFRARQAAEDRLVEMGESIKPHLKELQAQTEDLEVRTRVESILTRIEASRKSGTTYVDLHLKNATISDALAELAKQGAVNIPLDEEENWRRSRARINIDMEQKPFLAALQEICVQGNLQIFSDNESNIPYSVSQWDGSGANPLSGPTSISGPFLVIANSLSKTESIQLANPDNVKRTFKLKLVFMAEPKLTILDQSEVVIEQAVDDRGQSLLSGNRLRVETTHFGSQFIWDVQLRLKPPAEKSKRIERLAGYMNATIQTRSERLEIPDILNAQPLKKTIGGNQISFDGIDVDDNQYTVRVTMIQAPGSEGPEMDDVWFNPLLQLVDAEGVPLSGHLSGVSSDGNVWSLERTFYTNDGDFPFMANRNAGKPAKLIWDVPLVMEQTKIAFEFKDLPLP